MVLTQIKMKAITSMPVSAGAWFLTDMALKTEFNYQGQ